MANAKEFKIDLTKVDVRGFVTDNVTPYEGDASFLQ
jgi:pyruvate-formate lyase